MSFYRRPYFNQRQGRSNRPDNFHNDRYMEPLRNQNEQPGILRRRQGQNDNQPQHIQLHGNVSCGAPRKQNDNFFTKFKNLKEFKDFRRNLKIRKSMEEHGNNAKRMKKSLSEGTLFIKPDDIVDLKNEIELLRWKDHSAVDQICKTHARFHYYCQYKDFHSAKEASCKKSNSYNHGSKLCPACDCSFSDNSTLDVHLQTKFHSQVSKIHTALMKVGLSYLLSDKEPNIFPKEAKIAEQIGILINFADNYMDYSSLDVEELSEEEFVLGAFENRMAYLWPHPKSQYFCRICNYSEFVSQELLDRHEQSARHLDFERHYKEAFCIICQHHYGDAAQMQKHLNSEEHSKATEIMDFTKKHASHFWHLHHFKEKNSLSSKHKDPIDSSRHSVLNEVNKSEKNERTIKMSVPFVGDFVKRSPAKNSEERKKKNVQEINITMNNTQEDNNNTIIPVGVTTNNARNSVFSQSSTLSSINQHTESNSLANISAMTNDFAKKNVEVGNVISQSDNVISKKNEPNAVNLQNYDNYIRPQRTQKTIAVKVDDKDCEKFGKKEEKPKENKILDEFIVPLTGFMCTVCHETLTDLEEATQHQNTGSHKSKVTTHKLLFS